VFLIFQIAPFSSFTASPLSTGEPVSSVQSAPSANAKTGKPTSNSY